ncbi:2-polyprenyl-6-methoxyphenol hydroxylase [Streptomyces montanus]|uniref:2-polyprenyl-6-methoxyphenol hydroxylase n=1 Tax=Streptomyces montanus TaxID=2580423 RepID=A0A5R9FRI8_9ACTN|nr:FAD-dependent monooxygenase [Streptomyces montanus]TLS46587.1 2-polyprenyl-6-methoxyphenol hydroxylase [Streptomyces montanus]
MRIAVVGGGPGGLFFAALIRQADPTVEVTVFERNRADDAFGFGVVFSDRTLAGIHEADPVLRQALDGHGRHWQDIEVRLKGERIRCGGNGMAAIARRTLLALLQERALAMGADLRFSTEVDLGDLDGYDLVVAADGSGSRIREGLARRLEPSVETATAKFIWFGTDYMFDGLTFVHERGPHGVFAVHGYPISADVSTFIVETDEESWRAAGLDAFDVTQPPGPSDMTSKAYLEKLFAEQIDGHRLLVNNSRWGNFRTRRTRHWYVTGPRHVALLGDAAHTAHFSVGSGTKMAMEDAIALSEALAKHGVDLPAALAGYEAAARPSVEAIQGAARPSLGWWEHFGRYHDAFEPWQFAYHFLSRSISDARLGRRAPDFVRDSHERWRARFGTAPLDTPLDLGGGLRLPGRIVVLEPEVGGTVVARPADGGGEAVPLPLLASAPSETPGSGAPGSAAPRTQAPWGAWVAAPDDESGLDAARASLAALAEARPVLVAVHGGTGYTRTLLTEQARLHHQLPALLVDDSMDRDRAVTAVLSGRTDLVGAAAATVASWEVSR